jgi:hypothetical protein
MSTRRAAPGDKTCAAERGSRDAASIPAERALAAGLQRLRAVQPVVRTRREEMSTVSSKFVRSICAGAFALTLGCSEQREPELGTTRQALFDNDKAAYDFFRAKGLTNFQAAGVVGNLDQESGVDPTIYQYNGGPGRGIAQWSAGARWDSTDGDNVVQYANQHGEDEWSLELQLEFVWYELTTFEWYGLAELQASTTLEEATQAFEDKYEGCVYANFPVCALPSRVQFAQGILDAYGDDPAPEDDGGDGDLDGSSDDGTDGTVDDGATVDDEIEDGSGDGDGSSDDGHTGDGSTSDGSAEDGGTGDGSSSDGSAEGDGDGAASDGSAEDGSGGADDSSAGGGELDTGCSLASRASSAPSDILVAVMGMALLRRRRHRGF